MFHFPFFFFTITLPFLLQHYCVTVFPHLTVLHHQLLLDFSIILNLLPPAETQLWCLICSKLSMSVAISSWSASYICIGDKQSKRKNKTHKNKYFFLKKSFHLPVVHFFMWQCDLATGHTNTPTFYGMKTRISIIFIWKCSHVLNFQYKNATI